MVEKALGFLIVFLELSLVSRKLSLINHGDRVLRSNMIDMDVSNIYILIY